MTWNELAAAHPEFVQWIVATFGPLPDGMVREDDYNRFKVAYETALIDGYRDREPQPSDGPEYHADHQAWTERQVRLNDGYPPPTEAS